MALKKMITVFCFSLFALPAFSQSQSYAEDSVIAQRLIADKLKSLEPLNIVNYLYLFSDAGLIVILYEVNGKIKGAKRYYKGYRSLKFRNLKLSKEDKMNFNKSISIASRDTAMSFSNCNEFVHSFNLVFFAVSKNQDCIKGSFTSDCAGILDKNGIYGIHNIYGRYFLRRR